MAKPGPKPRIFTEEETSLVSKMSAVGISQEAIASVLGIDRETVARRFPSELKNAATKANVAVAGALYRNAIEGNVAAQIFWCKTRLHWRETSAIEVSGANGATLLPTINIVSSSRKPVDDESA